MMALAETLSSPIIRLHSEVTADFHARADEADAEVEENEKTGDADEDAEASRRWRRL